MTDSRPTVAVTGQRPQHMRPAERDFAQSELRRVVTKLAGMDFGVACSGMAIGTDQWFASEALEVGMALEAYLPFPAESQQKLWGAADRAIYKMLLDKAEVIDIAFDEVNALSLIPAYHERNQRLVNRVHTAEVGMFVAVTNGKSSGGTWDCLHRIANGTVDTVVIHTAQARTTVQSPLQLIDTFRLDRNRVFAVRQDAALKAASA